MRVDGQVTLEGIKALALWGFLTDANRIAECLPGCQKLTQTSDGAFDMEMRFGVGPICGVFRGTIRLHGFVPTSEYQMTVDGAGTPGFVKGEGTIQLTADTNVTLLRYSGEVTVGGAIASVGQRMIGSAARMV